MISIIVPAYNERPTIPIILKRIKAVAIDKEIIVVDDGSTDGTRQYLEALNDPVVKVVLHSRNQGKGAALRTGFQYAKGEILIIQDADLEYHPQDYLELIKPIQDGRADVVYGSRFIGAHRVFLFDHYAGNKILNLIANILYNTNLSDMMTGYKVFRQDVISHLKLKADGFGVEAEITAEVFKHGYRVYEVPISYSGRSYDEGKKINWYHFFTELYWLLRQKVVTYGVPLDTLVKMGSLSNYNRIIYKAMSPFIGKKVLEIGAGIGSISKYLLRSDQLVVTDISDENMSYLNSRFQDYPNIKILSHDIAESSPEELKGFDFDTIICLNILEHIKDDRKALANISSIMKKEARLIVLVPAIPALKGSLDLSLEHYRRYSKDGLRHLLEEVGFSVEALRYFNLLGALGWFLNSKILKRKSFSSIQVWFFNKICWLVKLEDRVEVPFGISLIAICKKV